MKEPMNKPDSDKVVLSALIIIFNYITQVCFKITCSNFLKEQHVSVIDLVF